MIPPFLLSGPDAAVSPGRIGVVPPLLLSSPHSGTHVPPEFLALSRVSAAELRRVEDAHVDQLLEGAVAAGAPLIRATHARAVIDLNRAEDEIDPGLVIGGHHSLGGRARVTERVRSGYGLLPRIVAPGRDIYSRRLTHAEAEARIARLHRPWHEAIDDLMARMARANGFALLLDCHSMPTPPGRPPAEIVLGTLHGRSAAVPLVEAMVDHLREAGWRVAMNNPYAGGHTTQRHADPVNGRHAVQVEVDRALYMDPATLEPHAGFTRVAAMFEGLTRLLLREAPYLLGGYREAAE